MLDRTIIGAMKEELKAADRKREAEALVTQLASRGSTWAKALRNLGLMFPTERADNATILEKFGEQFKWGGNRGPMELITEALNKLGLDEHKSINASADGEMLFQILRQRVPEGVAIMCLRNQAEKWQAVMELLQREYNINRSDAATEETVRMMTRGRKGKPKYVMVGETRRKQYSQPSTSTPIARNPQRSGTLRDFARGNTSGSSQETQSPQQYVAQPAPLNRGRRDTPRNPPPRRAQAEGATNTQQREVWHNPRSNPLGESNIYADLGLYIDRPVPMTCYQCYFPGHASRDCLCTILLKLNNEIIRFDNDTGRHAVQSRIKAVDQGELNEIERKWGSFLKGDNIAGEKFENIWDADKYLQSKGSEPLLQRIDNCAPMQDRRSRVTWKKGPGPRQRVGRELYAPPAASQAQRATAFGALN